MELAAVLRMPASRRRRVENLLKSLEWPMAILALLVVPALILEDRTTHAGLRSLCNAINWFVWLAFVAEFVLGFSVAPNRSKHGRCGLVRKKGFESSRPCGHKLLRLNRSCYYTRRAAIFRPVAQSLARRNDAPHGRIRTYSHKGSLAAP
jgi:hypothetical protein